MPEYATIARVEDIQNRLIYFSTEEFTMQSLQAVKEFMMKELKKAIEMIIQMEVNTQLEYLSIADFNKKYLEIEEKLSAKLSISDFNEALEKYDTDVKDENKETYDYIKTVKQHFALMTEEIERIREVFANYDGRLKDKANVSEVQQVWQNFSKYAVYQDFKDLYTRTVPEVKKFEEKMIKHDVDMQKTLAIVRRFDEVVTEKANKLELHGLEISL